MFAYYSGLHKQKTAPLRFAFNLYWLPLQDLDSKLYELKETAPAGVQLPNKPVPGLSCRHCAPSNSVSVFGVYLRLHPIASGGDALSIGLIWLSSCALIQIPAGCALCDMRAFFICTHTLGTDIASNSIIIQCKTDRGYVVYKYREPEKSASACFMALKTPPPICTHRALGAHVFI